MDRYEEALEKARTEYEKARKHGYTWLMDLLEGMFPDLKESEDEMLMNDIMEAVENWLPYERVEDIRAYLEKQKELPTNDEMLRTLRTEYEKGVADTIAKYERKEQKFTEKQDYSDLTDLERAIHRGFLVVGVENVPVTIIKETAQDCLAQMKQQKGANGNEKEIPNKQKPAERSYPYGRNETADRLVSLAECLEMDGDCLFNGYTGTECGKFLRDLAIKQVECKPVEWSKEDDEMRINILQEIANIKDVFPKINIQPEFDWLKSFPERFNLQPKQEWSEEDKEMVRRAIFYTEQYRTNYGDTKESEECFNWLLDLHRNIRPPFHWRPSGD